MSRKQEIYRQILSWVLPSVRSSLSQYRRPRWLLMLGKKRRQQLRWSYELSQLVHNLYVSILVEEFVDHDISFLNHQARSFYESNDEYCPHYNVIAYYIQELFKEVPDELRSKLEWNGPEKDYSGSRPRRLTKAEIENLTETLKTQTTKTPR